MPVQSATARSARCSTQFKQGHVLHSGGAADVLPLLPLLLPLLF